MRCLSQPLTFCSLLSRAWKQLINCQTALRWIVSTLSEPSQNLQVMQWQMHEKDLCSFVTWRPLSLIPFKFYDWRCESWADTCQQLVNQIRWSLSCGSMNVWMNLQIPLIMGCPCHVSKAFPLIWSWPRHLHIRISHTWSLHGESLSRIKFLTQQTNWAIERPKRPEQTGPVPTKKIFKFIWRPTAKSA